LVTKSGLGVVRSGGFDAPTLYRLARDSVSCEEKVATGCFMVQAAALVHCWALMRERDPLQHEREVVQFGQSTAPSAARWGAAEGVRGPCDEDQSLTRLLCFLFYRCARVVCVSV
jgi:hypothetical protein